MFFILWVQTGYVTIDGEDYMIEPVKGGVEQGVVDYGVGQQPHLLYKRSALVDHEEQPPEEATCGNQGTPLQPESKKKKKKRRH